MGPRKRVKTGPLPEADTKSTPASQPATVPSRDSSKSPRPVAKGSSSAPSKSGAGGDAARASAQDSQEVHKTKSWYGSWPRVSKSAASTQVARETILGGTSKPNGTADFSRFETKKASDAASVMDGGSSGSTTPRLQEEAVPNAKGREPEPAAAVPSQPAADPSPESSPKPTETQTNGVPPQSGNVVQNGSVDQTLEQQSVESRAEEQPPAQPASQRPASTWLGWFSRSATVEDANPAPSSAPSSTPAPMPEPEPEPEPEPAAWNEPQQPVPEASPVKADTAAQTAEESFETAAKPVNSRASWFWYLPGWSAPAAPQHDPEPSPPTVESETPAAKQPDVVPAQGAPATVVAAEETPTSTPKAGSTWAFWSRDSGSSKKQPAQPTQKGEQGQLAVMGERSENHPQKANSMEFKGVPPKEPPLKSGQKDEPNGAPATPSRESSSSKSSKKGRIQSVEAVESPPARPSTPKPDVSKPATPKAPAKQCHPNLLLPSFENTYKYKESRSILSQITNMIRRTPKPPPKHVYMTKEHPKIKRAIAIGVHGLFPAQYLRPVIGQPTGTSIKFANHCAEAIRRWANSHGCEDIEIEKVALEGEGKIGERVENLWKLLLNWIEQIRKADFILIGCHSQGVPVSIMLLEKLIDLGVVNSAKVGVCAMAGVSLGPFPDYRSSMGRLMGTAAELWEFGDPKSEVSKRLEAAVKACLNHGARITFIGSIDDQLVPLESAIYSPVHHPYVYRAVFIDGRIHAPDFIAHLVGFALKLRNLGISDHGLIRELSTPLAGSLYSGEGHSRLYDEERVYDLAVMHALHTTDLPDPSGAPSGQGRSRPGSGARVPCEVRHHRLFGNGSANGNGAATSGGNAGGGALTTLSNPNPYHLPWIMRGLLEEDFVKTELSAETAELVRKFDDWKPVTKALKDVKYRLEAVRSKL
ncbi:hypothetical protein VTJ83DRAFT_872 [Remersonia thermophila]|uniref:YMC020W-like alpha/beta hydrolase domain-containing protein n=1 Tax=Remersonia thermophila TaxID=72144 RepID=A0ABR4DME8_9PEZI